MKTLVLIANSENALLLQLEKGHFELIEKREHPQSKEKVEHLVSDRPGRTFSRMSQVRHALGEGQDILEIERQRFARELAGVCKDKHRAYPFKELWIVAGPKFLGELRHHLHNAPSLPFSIREIHKELSSHESLRDKMERIQNWVREGSST